MKLVDSALIDALRGVVGDRGLVTEKSRLIPYECDGLSIVRRAPELVVLPADTAQAAAVMKLLHASGVPVVARGAGTGLAGGATPSSGGVVVSLARMRQIFELDPVDRFARVGAGVVNIDLTRAAAEHGLFYAPDPSSQMACTIGGNVANNSGGPHCFRHGSTTRHILGLVIVTHEGEVLDLAGPSLDPAGLDLVGTFVGSEGMFGLATEVTVALTPTPEVTETLLAIFTDLDAACDSTSDMIAARLEPSAIEILDRLTIQAVEASVFAAGYPKDAEAVLLVEAEGSTRDVDATMEDIDRIVRARGAVELRRARDADERRALWAGRKGAFGAMGRIAPDLYVADVVVPRTQLQRIVRQVTDLCAAKDLKLSNVFHAGDGNLHPNISYDRRDKDELARVLAVGEEIMRLCVEAGGSLSGEHGVGLEKQDAMCLVFDDPDLLEMQRLRDAWDPDRRLNPGKLLPLRGCREIRSAPIVPHGAEDAQ